MDALNRVLKEIHADKLKKEGSNICGIDAFIEGAEAEEKRLIKERTDLQKGSINQYERERNVLRFELMSLPGIRQIIKQRRGVRHWLWNRVFNEQMFDLESGELIDQFVADQQLQLCGQEIIGKLLLKLRKQLRRMAWHQI